MVDIEELFIQVNAFNSGAEFEMKDPFGGATDLVFVIAGPFSAPFKAAKHWMQDEVAKKARPMRITSSGLSGAGLSAEDQDDIEVRFLSRLVLGWRGLREGGKEMVRTDETALRVLRDAPWLREQVSRIVNDTNAFRKDSGTTEAVVE